MTHTMKLNPFPFSQIENGYKVIELRLYDEKRRKIQIGDRIVFTNTENPSKSICAMVTALHRFPSFKELYATLPLLKCGYTEKTLANADCRDMLEYYSHEQEALYGVLGIEFTLI